jgi:hypothetical protein
MRAVLFLIHIISYHIISYHIISYHIISYHIISYHIISYQSFHFLLHLCFFCFLINCRSQLQKMKSFPKLSMNGLSKHTNVQQRVKRSTRIFTIWIVTRSCSCQNDGSPHQRAFDLSLCLLEFCHLLFFDFFLIEILSYEIWSESLAHFSYSMKSV